ncbi:hypothetical protein Indivirus_1_161 [Indivirus ILV1]|uniref:Uncharacterized protein n=1 Tax=Indivirus ILV1 TaxID=1977633 RepID=A0A1V0SD02_9VIRU|nr:hypothetical protein Indivirus_1_161 [Indivirus ILV1]
MKRTEKKNIEKMDSNTSEGGGVFVFALFSCFFGIFCIAIILSLVRYTMAAVALSKGDSVTAASILSEGRPTYHQHPVFSQQPASLFTVKL